MSASTPAPTNSGWKVTGQMEQSQMGAAGTFVPGVTVYFITGLAHQGSVWIESTKYTPGNVQDAINQRADLLDQVGLLTSDS